MLLNMITFEHEKTINIGALIGVMIAITISWDRNKSILWAIVHGSLNWLYVIYYYFFLKEDN